jgi:O-antigen/teichoic acid export membrane protein
LIEAPSMLRRAKGGRPDVRRAVSYARYGGPVAVGLVMALIVSVSDRFLIAAFVGEAAAGVYSASYGLADRTLDVLFLWVGMAAAPLAVSLLEREGRDSVRAQGEAMVLLTLPAAVGVALVAQPLAAVMMGADFRAQAAAIIPWIAAAGFLNGFTTYYLDSSLELARKTHLTIPILAVPAGVNIALNLLLLPRYGMMGAVAATVAAYAIGAAVTFIVGRRYFPLPFPAAAFLRTGAACLVMGAVVLALPEFGRAWLTLGLHAGAGALAFAAAALAFDAGPARAFAGFALRAARPSRLLRAA